MGLNGPRRGVAVLTRRHSALVFIERFGSAMRFEVPEATRLVGWIWVFLGAALLMPFPAFGWPLPERAVPIMWLMLGGAVTLLCYVARISWPCAALLGWAIVRAAYHAYPLRSLQVLALMLMAAMLYVLACQLPDRIARCVAWAFLIGAAWQVILGAFNVTGVYPWMAWVQPEQVGRPMGLLTHPNYWGSAMALSLPIVWALAGIPAALVVSALILRTISGGPVIAAAVAVVVMAWPLFTRRVRYAVIGVGTAAVGVTMTLHEWRLSGRREVWQAAWPDLARWPILGQGLGQWRSWADDFNLARFNAAVATWSQQHGGQAPDQATAQGLQTSSFFATLQAHSEPYQLWFELGLIGVVLGLCWLMQAVMAAHVVWRAAPASRLPGPWWCWGRAPLERAWIAVLAASVVNALGSPTWHLPAQAAITLFAVARVQADAHAFSAGASTDGWRQRSPERMEVNA